VDWKTPIWQQFGAAIDMLENAMRVCPEDVWPECWYIAYQLEVQRQDTGANEQAGERCGFERPEVTRVELLLYNMHHVQQTAEPDSTAANRFGAPLGGEG